MLNKRAKKVAIISWLTLLWFMLLGNAYAWEVPAFLRVNGGARLWFSVLDGDLVQADRTKLGFIDNLGLKKSELAWEYFATFRASNIHVVRVRTEPSTLYDQSANGSSLGMSSSRVGYDLDFYMTPQALVGLNTDVEVVSLNTQINNVQVGKSVYNYSRKDTYAVPSIGMHGTFYPMLSNVSLRPNLSARVNWWNYRSRSTWDCEIAAAVDVPINRLWTWTVNGGYRVWNFKVKRDRDRVDMTRQGFFVETSILF